MGWMIIDSDQSYPIFDGITSFPYILISNDFGSTVTISIWISKYNDIDQDGTGVLEIKGTGYTVIWYTENLRVIIHMDVQRFHLVTFT